MSDSSFESAIQRRLARIGESEFSGIVYRTASPRYASEKDMVSGLGAAFAGGRWNPKGTAAVYCSLTPEAALAETFALQRYYSWPDYGALPRIIVALQVRLTGVLDLTNGEVRRRLLLSEKRLLETDWRAEVAKGCESLTQQVGAAAAALGFEAIRVLSATSERAPNLVVFPENLRSASFLRLLAPN